MNVSIAVAGKGVWSWLSQPANHDSGGILPTALQGRTAAVSPCETSAMKWKVINCWLCRAVQQRGSCPSKQEEKEEKDEETEDDLRRAREFDEFKDGQDLYISFGKLC